MLVPNSFALSCVDRLPCAGSIGRGGKAGCSITLWTRHAQSCGAKQITVTVKSRVTLTKAFWVGLGQDPAVTCYVCQGI